jgi:hypothetical protein
VALRNSRASDSFWGATKPPKTKIAILRLSAAAKHDALPMPVSSVESNYAVDQIPEFRVPSSSTETTVRSFGFGRVF